MFKQDIHFPFFSLTLSTLADVFPKQRPSISSLVGLLDSMHIAGFSSSLSEGPSHSYDKVLPFLNQLKHGRSEESKKYLISHRYSGGSIIPVAL